MPGIRNLFGKTAYSSGGRGRIRRVRFIDRAGRIA